MNNKEEIITRTVIFEKYGCNSLLENKFIYLIDSCHMFSMEFYPNYQLYINQENKIVYVHETDGNKFKIHIDFWNEANAFFKNYEITQNFMNKMIKRHFHIDNCESRPSRGGYVWYIERELYENTRY